MKLVLRQPARIALLSLLLGACGPLNAVETPVSDLSSEERIATRVVEEQAVSATLTALAQPSEPDSPTIPLPEPPTVVAIAPSEIPVPLSATPTPESDETVSYTPSIPEGNTFPGETIFDDNGNEVGVLQGDFSMTQVVAERDGLPIIQGSFAVRITARIDPPGSTAEDGTGIAQVAFSIQDSEGLIVAERVEENAAYCSFGGGEPDCELWVFSEHEQRWPNGDPIQVGQIYQVNAAITLQNIEFTQPFWFKSFYVEP